MTDDEMRVKIAEACGWTRESGYMEYDGAKLPWTMWTRGSERIGGDKMPDYLNDLNAMHEAEKVLTAEQAEKYFTKLMFLEGGIGEPHWVYPDGTAYGRGARYSHSAHATARQRAEAFIRAIA